MLQPCILSMQFQVDYAYFMVFQCFFSWPIAMIHTQAEIYQNPIQGTGQSMPMVANMQIRPCFNSTALRRSKSSLVQSPEVENFRWMDSIKWRSDHGRVASAVANGVPEKEWIAGTNLLDCFFLNGFFVAVWWFNDRLKLLVDTTTGPWLSKRM